VISVIELIALHRLGLTNLTVHCLTFTLHETATFYIRHKGTYIKTRW